MKSRKPKPSRKLTALDVLAALDDVVKPFTTYEAMFGKDIDGTCFFATHEFHGTGKTFAEALVNWSLGRMVRDMDYLAVITGTPARILLGHAPKKPSKRKTKPARKRR